MLASLLLAPLAPDYAAPVFALVCLIYCWKLFRAERYLLELQALQIMAVLLFLWRVVGVFYSKFWLNSTAIMFLWLLSLSGVFLLPMLIRDRKLLDKALLLITVGGGVAGLIGILQHMLFVSDAVPPPLGTALNPFWKWLQVLGIRLLQLPIVPRWIIAEIPNKIPAAFPDRAYSTFTNPIFFACFLVLVFPIAFHGFFYNKKPLKKLLCFGSVLCILGGIAFSYSRGPYLALAITLVLLLFMGWRQAVLILATAPAGLAGMWYTRVFHRLLTMLNTHDSSINTRKKIWKACWELLKTKWPFGLGTGVEPLREILTQDYKIRQPHAHNLFLELLVENGVLGLLLFVGIFAFFCVDMFRLCRVSKEGRALGMALFAAVTGFIACGVTDYVFYGPTLLQYFLLMLGLSQAAKLIIRTESKAGSAPSCADVPQADENTLTNRDSKDTILL